MPELFAQEPGDSQVSGHCGEKKHRGLAVLVGLMGWEGASMSIPRGRRELQKRSTVR